MLDFGALPPEVNSGRMYAGAGSGPMLAAAAVWEALAAELLSAATSYSATIDGLTTGPWTGPSSTTIAASVAPYVAWMTSTGTQAEEAAARAQMVAAAYQTAFAATVPPPMIEANRAQLMALVASNILGQNTPAIAATEAQYMEMWAQDATAMYVYGASATSASQLTPFTEPPKTTNDSAGPAQAAAVSQANSQSAANTAAQLSQAATAGPTTVNGASAAATTGAATAEPIPPLLAAWQQINYIWDKTLGGPFSVYGINDRGLIGPHWLLFGLAWAANTNGIKVADYFAGPKPVLGALAPLVNGIETVPYVAAPDVQGLFASSRTGGSVSAAMGTARSFGGLSVPSGWAQTAPIRLLAASTTLATAGAPAAAMGAEAGMLGQMALSSLAGRAVAATAVRSSATGTRSPSQAVAEADPAAATIIVIPALDDE